MEEGSLGWTAYGHVITKFSRMDRIYLARGLRSHAPGVPLLKSKIVIYLLF